MSKSALNIQTKILRNYLGPDGFETIAVHPGWMRSGMGSLEATFSPGQAAKNLFPLITAPRGNNEPWYIQFDGTPLPY